MLRRFLQLTVDNDGNIVDNTKTDNYKLFNGGEIDLGGIIVKQVI